MEGGGGAEGVGMEIGIALEGEVSGGGMPGISDMVRVL